MTGLSRAQLTRLMAQHRSTGRIRDRRSAGPSRPFTRRYTAADIRLLTEVDTALGQRCGPATRAVLRRQYEVFGDERFARLAGLSNGHLYNLRASRTYAVPYDCFRDEFWTGTDCPAPWVKMVKAPEIRDWDKQAWHCVETGQSCFVEEPTFKRGSCAVDMRSLTGSIRRSMSRRRRRLGRPGPACTRASSSSRGTGAGSNGLIRRASGNDGPESI